MGVLFVGAVVGLSDCAAAPLQSAIFSELGGGVWVLEKEKPVRKAVLRSRVGGKSSVKTGEQSRAELEFDDKSLVRLGSNAIYAFQPGTRSMRLDIGALLLFVPKGSGGATTISTATATATISGTTVIISATKSGGFRMLVLEGVADVRYANGKRIRCRAGDMTVLPGAGAEPSGPNKVDVKSVMASSGLIKRFSKKLPSLPLIAAVIQTQEGLLASGQMQPSGGLFGDSSLEPWGDRDRIRSVEIRTSTQKDIRDNRPRYTKPNRP